MNTTSPAAQLAASTIAVAIAPSTEFPGRLDVFAGETRVGTVIDGGHIVKNADRVLRANRVLRSSGFELDADRRLVAAGVEL